jgi:hypothetical protein
MGVLARGGGVDVLCLPQASRIERSLASWQFRENGIGRCNEMRLVANNALGVVTGVIPLVYG